MIPESSVSPPPGFPHRMAAHCESGTVSTLLGAGGLKLSEAMVFGITGAVCFVYLDSTDLPFPTIAMRNQPGEIWQNTQKVLGADFSPQTFKTPAAGFEALDRLLDQGERVAAQVDFFHMDYIPAYARAHFNAHFITVVGRVPSDPGGGSDGVYIVSDSYAPELTTLSRRSLELARFARGRFAPKGLLLHLKGPVPTPDMEKAVREGIRAATSRMVSLPLPFLGVRGIRRFAERVKHWRSLARSEEHFTHELMMVYVAIEERGTGGGGFRFLYASFLQEAAGLLGRSELAELAGEMMENGDRWRDISLRAAVLGKRGGVTPEHLTELSGLILARADVEERLFRRLAALKI